MHRFLVPVAGAALALAGNVNTAHAGGLEYAGAGARGLARGGANAARPEDAQVLKSNPAGLARMTGNTLSGDLNFAFMNACYDAVGYYGWGVYLGGTAFDLPNVNTGQTESTVLEPGSSYYTEELPEVCMDQNVQPIPQLALTHRINEQWGIGYGMVFPAAQPVGNWGNKYALIDTPNGVRPAPSRYMLLGNQSIGAFPTVGIAYKPFPAVSIGAAFEWGMIFADARTMTSVGGGTPPNADLIAHIKANDYFVPAFNASIHLKPTSRLDVVLAYRYQDPVKATGTATIQSGLFSALQNPLNSRLRVDELRQNMPWNATLAIRYAHPLSPGEIDPEGPADPLGTERWDVEVDLQYQGNSRNQVQVLDLRDGQRVLFDNVDGSSADAAAPAINEIQKHWKDQISARLGGSYSFVPGIFAVSLGAHYENRGVDANYTQVDYWPFQRVGLHAGATFRIDRTVDITISYAHIFQETITVGAPAHTNRADRGFDKTVGMKENRFDTTPPPNEEQNPATNPDGIANVYQQISTEAEGQPPYIINAGRYRSSFDILAIGLSYHF